MTKTTDAEEWRGIPGFPDYIVSNRGSVRRIYGKTAIPLALGTWRSGHRFVYLRNDAGERKPVGAHVLVMAAFVGPNPDKLFVCHNNGDPGDNYVGNLRYDTSAGNRADTYRHGTHIYGSMSKVAKLTEDQVRQIRELRSTGQTCVSLARQYGVSESTVSKLTRGDTWVRA